MVNVFRLRYEKKNRHLTIEVIFIDIIHMNNMHILIINIQ